MDLFVQLSIDMKPQAPSAIFFILYTTISIEEMLNWLETTNYHHA